jgi:hypothetical protein
MINTKQAARLRYLITERCKAERADEMKGAYYPEDVGQIEAELRMAQLALNTHIVSITADKETVAMPVSVEQARAIVLMGQKYLSRRGESL